MFEFDNDFSYFSTINIDSLLKEIDLPVRLINNLKNNTFYNEESFFKEVEKIYIEHTSHYLFPNTLISFYPQVREQRASSELTCDLSGAKIKKGSLYYTYHPFMENLINGKVYTIKKMIKAELSFIDLFPQDLFTYEEWYYKLKNAYYIDDDIIDFYNLSISCGENCLEPYLLGKSKNKRKK